MESFAAPANLAGRFVTDATLPRLCESILDAGRRSGAKCDLHKIGSSRAGRELIAFSIGEGHHQVSITAGAHSDEPIGPMTAMQLASWLACGEGDARDFTSRFSFSICPQVNPDGAAFNSAWFSDPIDPRAYFETVMREQPGDDIEFGYAVNSNAALRPENEAVAGFLKTRGPFVFHSSLHGMAYAEGAWFLICKEWGHRSGPLQDVLSALTAKERLPLHDIDRRGEKGFTRIAQGFCTTPTSTAMQAYFQERGDEAMASLFRLSSMELVQSIGGDPLAMVSELPLFLITDPIPRPSNVAPQPGETAYEKFRTSLGPAGAAYENGDEQPIQELMRKYHLLPVSLQKQVTLQGRMVLAGAAFAANLLSN